MGRTGLTKLKLSLSFDEILKSAMLCANFLHIQGTYLTSTATSHANDHNLHEGTVIGKFNGEFWGMFACHQVQYIWNVISKQIAASFSLQWVNVIFLFPSWVCSLWETLSLSLYWEMRYVLIILEFSSNYLLVVVWTLKQENVACLHVTLTTFKLQNESASWWKWL